MLVNDAIKINQIMCKLKELEKEIDELQGRPKNFCLNVEGATTPFGSASEGSAVVKNNEKIRFWSQTVSLDVQEGSALVNMEVPVINQCVPPSEDLTIISGATGNPDLDVCTTFICTTGATSVAASGILSDASENGQIKYIVGSEIISPYELTITSGVDANGTDIDRIDFNITGQTAQLIWSEKVGKWLIIGGSGADVVPA